MTLLKVTGAFPIWKFAKPFSVTVPAMATPLPLPPSDVEEIQAGVGLQHE